MKESPSQTHMFPARVVSYLLFGSLVARAYEEFLYRNEFSTVIWLLAGYLVLYTTERWISRWLNWYLHLYFALQILITLYLLLIVKPFDYFAILIVPLCIQAIWHLPQKIATGWIGFFIITASASLIESSLSEREGFLSGLGLALAYGGVSYFASVISLVTLRAEKARHESQLLLAELQKTHRKLREYADQVEELAAAQERNLLARELHDSVTQTIFSMTLTAQATRILLDRDPSRVAGQLDHLQDLAHSALGEMRDLIQQLRPKSITEEGLPAALRKHIADREKNEGLSVDLVIAGERQLPLNAEKLLFRVVQEALNNVVKHAGTSRARVTLCLDQDPVSLTIEDEGVGFDPGFVKLSPTHLGLTSMADRVQSLGGTLKIVSKPGLGTQIRVDNIRVEEREHV